MPAEAEPELIEEVAPPAAPAEDGRTLADVAKAAAMKAERAAIEHTLDQVSGTDGRRRRYSASATRRCSTRSRSAASARSKGFHFLSTPLPRNRAGPRRAGSAPTAFPLFFSLQCRGSRMSRGTALADPFIGSGEAGPMNESCPRVMVIDDDGAICRLVGGILDRQGCRAIALTSGDDPVTRLAADRPSAVILNVVTPGLDGLATLGAIKKFDREIPVIVVSGRSDTTTVVQAMRLGAADFVAKPFEEEALRKPLAHALRQRELSAELAALRTQIQLQPSHRFLLGSNPRVAEVRGLIDRVADTDVTVLVRGESGTGKELVARAIHSGSARRDRPFVKVNCAALPTELLGVGAVRLRARRVHGRDPAEARQVRVRQPRDDVPRRDRRDAARRCRQSCCRCSRTASSRVSAARPTSASTCGSWRPPTGTSSEPWR